MTLAVIKEYLQRGNCVVDNANTGYSNQGLMSYLAQTEIAKYWLEELYPPQVAREHREGAIHLHDNGHLTGYCAGFDLFDLLQRGFGGVTDKVQSAPPKHFSTALGQAVNFMYTLAGEIAGAVAFSNFDTLLAPFIRYDHLTYEQVKQHLQEFVFNLNVPTRTGFQSPFTNITLDLKCPRHFAQQAVIVGGQAMNDCYGDFQWEQDILNRAFAEVMLAGDASGRVFTFPIPTYNITNDFEWTNPAYTPIWQMTGRFGNPYFANFVGSDMNPEDATSMCCRLRIDRRKLQKRHGGLFASAPLTGSIGVVTLNLPQAAYLARGNVEKYYERLGELCEVAAMALHVRRAIVEKLTDDGFYPYLRHYLDGVKAGTGGYWSNHFNTIGIVGANEAALNLYGVDILHPKGRALAVDTLRFLRSYAEKLQAQDSGLWNIEATPAESAGGRMALLDKRNYPDIKAAGAEGAWYYTNSTQTPANSVLDFAATLDHQSELQALYTGGTVVHVRLGESIEDPQIVRALIQTITSKWSAPYISLTPVFSVCPTHGYISGRHDTCPRCGKATDIYDRIVGYLQPLKIWNPSKRQEEVDRTDSGRVSLSEVRALL